MEDKEKEAKKVVEEDENDLLDPDDFEDEDSGEDNTETETSDDDKKSTEEDKEKEKNAKEAERRRKREKAQKERAEREAKIREEATLKAELGILKINPYTEEPIEDEEDLKIYKVQKELEDEGKDPVNDLPKRLAENARKAQKEAKESKEREEREKIEIDKKVKEEIAELKQKYPKLNLQELANDELFKECLYGRAGRWTQVEIYELYLSKKAAAEKKAEEEAAEKTAKEAAKKISNPPSATARGSSPQKGIDDMTKEEFERYFREKYNC